MTAPRNHCRAARQRRPVQGGFTLLEVLTALVVLSIGMLGIAQLEILSLRSTNSSFLRGQAVALAYDMSDRMLANQLALVTTAGVPVGFYNAADTATYMAPADRGCSEKSGTAATNCSIADMASHDQFEWQQMLVSVLPAGAGVTCRDSTPDDGTSTAPACDDTGDAYAVKVWWDDIEQDGPVTKRIVLGVRP